MRISENSKQLLRDKLLKIKEEIESILRSIEVIS